MYFDKFTTEAQIKERFRKLAKHLHPDMGGDKDLMVEVTLEYNQALIALCTQHDNHIKPPEPNPEEVTKNIIEKLDMITRWALKNPNFDLKFIDSLRGILKKGGILTTSQENALDRIINVWKIDQDKFNDRSSKYKRSEQGFNSCHM